MAKCSVYYHMEKNTDLKIKKKYYFDSEQFVLHHSSQLLTLDMENYKFWELWHILAISHRFHLRGYCPSSLLNTGGISVSHCCSS